MGKLIEFDQDDNNTIETLKLISEIDIDKIERLFESFCFHIVLSYVSGEPIRIPYVGNIIIKLNDTDGTYTVEFEPHKNFKKSIEQSNKALKSGMIMDIDLVKLFQNRIKLNLKNNDCLKDII